LSYGSLVVARSLGRRGIPVFGIDKDKNRIGVKSRYIRFLHAPLEDEGLLDLLLNFAAKSDSTPVLYVMEDQYLLFLSRHMEKLRASLSFPYLDGRLLRRLVLKQSMARVFRAANISIPTTAVLDGSSPKDLANLGLTFPLLIKPNLHER